MIFANISLSIIGKERIIFRREMSKSKRWVTPFYNQIHADKLDTINRNISKLYDPIMSMV